MDRVSKALGVALVALGLIAAIYAIWPPAGSAVRDWLQSAADTSADPAANQPGASSTPGAASANVAPAAEPVVVIVGQRRMPHPPAPATGGLPAKDPGSSASLLQKELKRVGCYDGAVNGEWTLATKAAAKAFTDRVNARLPLHRPDPILLALVQGYKDKVCGAPCPPGQVLKQDQCLPTAILAQPKGRPGDGGAPAPAIASWATTVASPEAITAAADGRGPSVAAVPPAAPRAVGRPATAPRSSSSAGLASSGGGGWAASLLRKNWGPY